MGNFNRLNGAMLASKAPWQVAELEELWRSAMREIMAVVTRTKMDRICIRIVIPHLMTHSPSHLENHGHTCVFVEWFGEEERLRKVDCFNRSA